MQKKVLEKDLKLLGLRVGKGGLSYQHVVNNMEYFDKMKIRCKSVIIEGGHTWMNARLYLAETLQKFFKD